MISIKGYMVPSLAIGVRKLDGVWEYSYDLEKWFPCDRCIERTYTDEASGTLLTLTVEHNPTYPRFSVSFPMHGGLSLEECNAALRRLRRMAGIEPEQLPDVTYS